MVKVKDLMNPDVRTISPKKTAFDAAKVMAESDTGLLVVIEGQGIIKNPVGVISDTDILKKVIVRKLSPEKVLVEDIMTKKLVFVSDEDSATDAANKMKAFHYKRLPVLHDNRLVGIISNKELINIFINYKKELLDLAINF